MKFLNPKARKGTSRLVRRTMRHTTTKRDLIEEMSAAEALAAEQEWRMKTTRERQIARLDNIHRRIADFQKYPGQLSEAQKARWYLLIEERDRVQQEVLDKLHRDHEELKVLLQNLRNTPRTLRKDK